MKRILAVIVVATVVSSLIWLINVRKREPIPEMKNPRIVVKKKERKLELFDGEELVRVYDIALGFAPVGDKEIEGDGKTPEGDFYVFTKNDQSKYYLSLGLSYPSVDDAQRGLAQDLITQDEYDSIKTAIAKNAMPPQNTKLGGEIYIHGSGASTDWTEGCVALADEVMKEIFESVPIGTRVKIIP